MLQGAKKSLGKPTDDRFALNSEPLALKKRM
jgi:hypothetical protein